jgi:hypothetical protein
VGIDQPEGMQETIQTLMGLLQEHPSRVDEGNICLSILRQKGLVPVARPSVAGQLRRGRDCRTVRQRLFSGDELKIQPVRENRRNRLMSPAGHRVKPRRKSVRAGSRETAYKLLLLEPKPCNIMDIQND